ncbi:ABC transporter permease [Curtobacterium sp. MCBD17_013]|uniref:ABC transporter permease n=1 Tax=Curtobacterium sp. MCBD17_013 TaxID=2175668 RepID=UPI000DA7009F|nr:ABC transporter permease [Curtobacterium sp. MCBD17_013]PZF63702.1 ABC transporter permease [Curtobacterium sp. MCBD17_013]
MSGRFGSGRLGTVVRFEFVRTVKKPSFWIGTLALPVLIVVVGLLVGAGNAAGADSVTSIGAATKVPFTYVDHSGLVSERVAARWGGTPTSDARAAVARVRAGTLDAFVEFPADPATGTIEVAARDAGLFGNQKYANTATKVLHASVAARVHDPEAVRLLRGTPATNVTAYAHGHVAPGWASALPPMVFAAAFFALVLLLAARMVTVVVEEKENRISEMILTTLDATVLVRGKVIAMLLVVLVQLAVFLVPSLATIGVVLPVLAARFGPIPVDPWRMLVGALLLVGGVLLASSLFVTVGAAVPTIKDASALQSVALFSVLIPVYAVFFVLTNPTSPVTAVFTYFPTFTPVTAMLRNAMGTLDPVASVVCVLELYVAAFLVLRFAVFLFRHSVAQYGSKVTLRQVRSWRSARRPTDSSSAS